MAISYTSITPLNVNMDGKIKEAVLSIVIAGTYSAGGTVLTAAQAKLFGSDGKVIWVENDAGNLLLVKYNSTTGAIQLFLPSAAAGVAEAGAISGAGTYLVRVHSIGSASSAPFLS